MDIRLEEDMDYEVLVRQLDSAMPQGLHILSAAEAVAKPGELCCGTYRLTLSCPAAVVQAALAAPELLVEKRTKKKTIKIVDVLPYFADAQVETAETGTIVTVTLPCNSQETVNPGLFLKALNAHSGGEWQMDVLRLELLKADGRPFV